MLKPIRIDFTSIWKKKWYLAKMYVGRIHSIDSGCYCYSWFLKPVVGQLSRHTTFICKHIKKKSPNKRRLKKKGQWSCALTMIHYQLTQEKLQWEYTHWIIHYAKALIYCGNNIHLIKRFCFAAVGRLHIVYCYKLMAVQRRLWNHPNNRSVMTVLYIIASSAAS